MKRVLILTVDSWNLNICANSSYTYSSLFSSMDGYEISNIYLRDELPNDPCCKRYFQISENKIIKSLFKRKIQTGREVACGEAETKEDIAVVEAQKNLYNKQRRSFYYAKKMVREIIWFVSPWKSKQLDNFIDSVKPDVVIFTMEGYIHFNRLCRYVLRKTQAKGIGYFWDDYFTYKTRPGGFGKNPGYKLLRYFQRRSLKKLSAVTDAFWAISPKTKKEADEFFGIDCILLPKPSEKENAVNFEEQQAVALPIKMLYAGNLMIGRMDTIKTLAKVLCEINKEQIKIQLDIYSSTDVPKELLNMGHGIIFHKPVSQSEILDIQTKADILLFAEDIIGKQRKAARLSFSTKIPDYLSCGKCILALGDKDIAPMEYFKEENVALCASDESEIKKQIEYVLNNPSLLAEYGKRAYECAKNNHSKAMVQGIIRETIDGVLLK